jgi:hypothetical protein
MYNKSFEYISNPKYGTTVTNQNYIHGGKKGYEIPRILLTID